MKVDCGITVYNPDILVIQRIQEYVRLFNKVYVFDNTELKSWSSVNEQLQSMDNIVYFGCKENLGLSIAFNKILDVIDIDVSYLCTMDQDSHFYEKDIKQIKDYLPNLEPKIAIVAPRIIYHKGENIITNEELIQKRFVITSGSFLSLDVIRRHAIRYDEAYFIDRFEVDLCKQLRNLGYVVAQYSGAVLYQQLGEESGYRHPNHSIVRHYYLFRNRFYYNNKFHRGVKKYSLNLLQTLRHVANICAFENDKISKLAMMPKAIKDYYCNNMGKY